MIAECTLTAHPICLLLLLARCKTWFGQIKLLRISVILIQHIVLLVSRINLWDCVLNDLEELEELGCKEFLVLTDQHNIEIFSCCLRLLPSCSSTHHQTNAESTQICSEDHLSLSRIRSPHLLLEVIVHAEEECFVFLPLGTLDRIELLV